MLKTKNPTVSCGVEKLNRVRLATATELGLELLNATSGINEALFTGVGWMRVHGNVANHNAVLNAINGFLLLGLDCGMSQKLLTGRNVDEANRLVIWMNIFSHLLILNKLSAQTKLNPGGL